MCPFVHVQRSGYPFLDYESRWTGNLWAVVGFPTIAVKCSKRVAALEAGFNEEQSNFIEFQRGWGKSGEGSVRLILLCSRPLPQKKSADWGIPDTFAFFLASGRILAWIPVPGPRPGTVNLVCEFGTGSSGKTILVLSRVSPPTISPATANGVQMGGCGFSYNSG